MPDVPNGDCGQVARITNAEEGGHRMQMRFFYPTLGGIIGVLIARSQHWFALETFACLIGGALLGFGLYMLMDRRTGRG